MPALLFVVKFVWGQKWGWETSHSSCFPVWNVSPYTVCINVILPSFWKKQKSFLDLHHFSKGLLRDATYFSYCSTRMSDQTTWRTYGKLLIGNMPVKCTRQRVLNVKLWLGSAWDHIFVAASFSDRIKCTNRWYTFIVIRVVFQVRCLVCCYFRTTSNIPAISCIFCDDFAL